MANCEIVREDGVRCQAEGSHSFHIGWKDFPSNIVYWENIAFSVVETNESPVVHLLNLARKIRSA